jgi:hypothetical protein
MPELTPYSLVQRSTLEWQLCKEKVEEALCVVPEEAGPFIDAAMLHCTRIGIFLQFAEKHGWQNARNHAEGLHWSAVKLISAL